MKLDDLNIIFEWKLPQLWAYVNAYEAELSNESQESLKKIKYGYNIQVHINYLTEKHYKEYPENQQAIIINKKYAIQDLWDEIQEREKQLREIIIILNEEEEPYTPR